MKPSPLLLVLAALAAPAFAGPQCPSPGSGGVSANWGVDYRDRVRQIFDAARFIAGDGLDPKLALIFVNDLPKQSGTRMVDGSPISALEKGTLGLETDAVIYTFGALEIACDEAQLGTFMLHELKHVKRGPDGKNHLDRVRACRKKILDEWIAKSDLTAYYPPGAPAGAGDKAALAAFEKEKGGAVATSCVKPVENEADAFAVALAPRLPYPVDSSGRDPNRDARVQAFANAEKWIAALGLPKADEGHGTAEERKQAAAWAVHVSQEKERLQSLPPPF